MTPSRNQKDLAGFDLVMDKKLYALLTEKCRNDGVTRAFFVRRVLALALGQPNLAEMPRGIGEKTQKPSGKRINGHRA
jgi:hypothetical protein